MRIRPFFWFLLAMTCMSVFIFATFTHTDSPAILQVAIDRHPPTANGMTTLKIQLTDPQGLPIEKAQVTPSAKMTNMNMAAPVSAVKDLGHGYYRVDLALNMSGPWAITIQAQATGFMLEERTLAVQVV